MFQYLALTDGTTTIELTDLIGYALVSYAPTVAPLRDNNLGGGPYSDVQDAITFHALGATAAEAYAAADAVGRLLDQATRWWRLGQNVRPVLLAAQAQGTTLAAAVQSIVKGRPIGGAPPLTLPATWSETYGKYVIQNITIQFLRGGEWISGSVAAGPSGAVANPTVMAVSTGATITNSLLRIAISGFDSATTPIIKAGYLVVAADVVILEAEGGAPVGAFTSVNDAANNARGGNVLRYTPTGITPQTCNTINYAGAAGTTAILAAVRNNSATTSFQLQANVSALGLTVSTIPVLIGAGSTQPRLLLLGTVAWPVGIGSAPNLVSLTATASAAAGSLDIDYLIVANIPDETASIVALQEISLSAIVAGACVIEVVYNPIVDSTPRVQVAGPFSGGLPITFTGALPLFANTAGLVRVVWAATNGASWRFTDNTSAVLNTAMNVTTYSIKRMPE